MDRARLEMRLNVRIRQERRRAAHRQLIRSARAVAFTEALTPR